MMRSESNGAKRIMYLILGAVLVLVLTIGFGAYLYKTRNVSEEVPSVEKDSVIAEMNVSEEIPIEKIQVKKETVVEPKKKTEVQKTNVTFENTSCIVAKEFERINIIPIRSPRTEPIAVPKKSIFGRMINYFWPEKKEETPEIFNISDEEMSIQLDSTQNIVENYNSQLISAISKEKTDKKSELIINIRAKILELASMLPPKETLFDDSKNLFWLTVYRSGDLMIDWFSYRLSVKELENISNEVTALSNSESEVAVVRNSFFEVLKKHICLISKKNKIGGDITRLRESIGENLRSYKIAQDMIQITEESCQTEKLLLALDVLSYTVPMTSESRSKILKKVTGICKSLENAIKSTAKRQLNDYLRITKKYNGEIIKLINVYMQFIADFEQYVDINARNMQNVKNLERKNASSYAYNFSPEEEPAEVITEVGKKIALSFSIFKQYRDLLSIKEDAPIAEAVIQSEKTKIVDGPKNQATAKTSTTKDQ